MLIHPTVDRLRALGLAAMALGMSLYAKRLDRGNLALSIGRRGINLGGAGLCAGRDRLAESATELATAERGLIQKKSAAGSEKGGQPAIQV